MYVSVNSSPSRITIFRFSFTNRLYTTHWNGGETRNIHEFGLCFNLFNGKKWVNRNSPPSHCIRFVDLFLSKMTVRELVFEIQRYVASQYFIFVIFDGKHELFNQNGVCVVFTAFKNNVFSLQLHWIGALMADANLATPKQRQWKKIFGHGDPRKRPNPTIRHFDWE